MIFFLKNKNFNKENGYALLFTMVIVSVILGLATGMANSINKQIILSSTARDSQIAFYQADTGAECAIYAMKKSILPPSPLPPVPVNQWSCGRDEFGNSLILNIESSIIDVYDIYTNLSSNSPCFKINIDKTNSSNSILKIRGYNICSNSNSRQVERGIEVLYQ